MEIRLPGPRYEKIMQKTWYYQFYIYKTYMFRLPQTDSTKHHNDIANLISELSERWSINRDNLVQIGNRVRKLLWESKDLPFFSYDSDNKLYRIRLRKTIAALILMKRQWNIFPRRINGIFFFWKLWSGREVLKVKDLIEEIMITLWYESSINQVILNRLILENTLGGDFERLHIEK